MKRRTTLLLAIGALLLLPTGAQAADTTVDMKSAEFLPETLTVSVGDTVTWINKDAVLHDVVAEDASWQTPRINPNESASVTFSTPGTYRYRCTLHAPMWASLTVVAGAPSTDTAPPAAEAGRPSSSAWHVLVGAGLVGLLVAGRRFRRAAVSR